MNDQSGRIRFVNLLDKTGYVVNAGSGAISVAILVAMVLVVLVGVFFRYVVGDPFQWTEELARFLMLWSGFLAMNLAMRSGEHIKIDFVVKAMPETVEKVIGYMVDILMGIFLVILTIKGYQMTEGAFMMALSMDFSMAWIYASVPVGSLLTLVQLVLNTGRKVLLEFGRP